MADIGINFRATSGYVTDGAGETYCLDTDSYPTTRGGATFGWEDSVVDNGRDRDDALDPRLAGEIFAVNDGNSKRFRIDLDAAGAYEIELSLGTAPNANRAHDVELRDSATAFQTFTVGTHSSSGAEQFYDASQVLRNGATAWVSNQVAISRTFSSQIFRVVLNASGNNTGDATSITHVAIRPAAGASVGRGRLIGGKLVGGNLLVRRL